MVVICLPTAAATGVEHERTATPSIWTVQAPHCAMPQPYLVPVRPTFSRNAHKSGILGSTSTLCDWPLMLRVGILLLPFHRRRQRRQLICASGGLALSAIRSRGCRTIAYPCSNEKCQLREDQPVSSRRTQC